MDNLASQLPTAIQDPFDTSQFWPTDRDRPNDTTSTSRPNYDTNSISRPNYDANRTSRPSFDTNSTSRPNYDTNSISRPNYDINSIRRPSYETNSTSRPNYDFQGSRYDTQSLSRPNYELQSSRTNYDIQLDPSRYSYETQAEPSVSQSESLRYSRASTDTQIYNNKTPTRNNSIANNYPYGAVSSTSTHPNPNALSMERNVPNMSTNALNMAANSASSISTTLADMSLDDRISESLNLRSKNSNGENLYSNSPYHVPSSAGPSNVGSEYNDIPPYGNSNFDINPTQQQFLLETKDYYTKFSTPAKASTDNYEKNIYIPKYEDEAEKLKNFSDNLENSKNYSAFKYQNVDYAYASYSDMNAPRGVYDEVNDSESNVYSEIGEAGSVYAVSPHYANRGLYDEVYEEAPRPHRPAPPCPTQPK